MAHIPKRLILVTVLATCLTGCATAQGPRRVDDYATFAMWSRVGEVPTGSPITIAMTNTPVRARIFLSADAARVTVVNIEAPSLPPSVVDTLRSMAAHHPEYFMATRGLFEQDGVRFGREGLFVGDRQVATFAQVVETIPRDAVREIRGPVVARGSVPGTIAGAWLGFALGAVPALGAADAAVGRMFLAGSVTLGGWLGYRWSNHTVDDVVYRAP